MTTEKHPCEKMVFDGFCKYQCRRNAKVERDSKWYCTQHDPVRVAEKGQEKNLNCLSIEEMNRRLQAAQHYCQNLTTDYLETHVAEIQSEHKPENEL